jgi:hypothetical protein
MIAIRLRDIERVRMTGDRRIAARKARLLGALHKLAPRGMEKTTPIGKPSGASGEGRVSIYG